MGTKKRPWPTGVNASGSRGFSGYGSLRLLRFPSAGHVYNELPAALDCPVLDKRVPAAHPDDQCPWADPLVDIPPEFMMIDAGKPDAGKQPNLDHGGDSAVVSAASAVFACSGM